MLFVGASRLFGIVCLRFEKPNANKKCRIIFAKNDWRREGMFCRNCGFKHKETDAKFCASCGAVGEVPPEATHADETMVSSQKQSASVMYEPSAPPAHDYYAPPPMYQPAPPAPYQLCTNCRTTLEAGSIFCNSCGARQGDSLTPGSQKKSRLPLIIGIATVVAVAIVAFFIFSNSDHRLVGKWELEDAVGISRNLLASQVEFFSDGTGVTHSQFLGVRFRDEFNWSVERDIITTVHRMGTTMVYNYRISGSILTFYYYGFDGGVYATYRRVR